MGTSDLEKFSKYCDLNAKAYMQLLVFFLFQLRCNCGISNYLPKKTLKNDVPILKIVKNGLVQASTINN